MSGEDEKCDKSFFFPPVGSRHCFNADDDDDDNDKRDEQLA